MSWMEGTRARLRLLFSRRASESRMEEEIRFHIDMEAERLEREAGLNPREARRRALVAFGGVEKYREELREGRGLAWLAGMSLDLKLGLRMLARSPGLTVVACLALAVAIGGGAAYLEFLDDLFHGSLPIRGGERVVGLYNLDASRGHADPRAMHDLVAWREELESVEELGGYREVQRNLVTADGRSEPVEGVEISASAFRIAGERPLLGRPLIEEDERPGAPPVAVIGHDLWLSRFAGDPGVVGRAVRLGSAQHTVVGVMQEGFGFPVNHGLWVPLRLDVSAYPRGAGPEIRVFGRLAEGSSLESAQAELTAVGRRAATDFADTHEHLRPRVEPYVQSLWLSQQDGVLQMRILYGLNLFFLGLLAVCAANVATLVFARTATREGEITVRSALGASRGRVVAQLFAEALVLAGVAAAAGLATAAFGLRWVRGTLEAAGGTRAPFWWTDGLNPETLLYAAALTVLAAGIIGVVPALKATGPHLQARLRGATAGGSGMRFGGVWTGVIVTQIALTVLFLLIVFSVGWNVKIGRYGAPELAFPEERYLTVRLETDAETPAGAPVPEAQLRARVNASYAELERRLEGEPGVETVTYASPLPGTAHPWIPLEVDGAAAGGEEMGGAHGVRIASVDAGFFEAFDAPIVSGRGFGAADAEPGRAVAVVDEKFVLQVLGGSDAVGVRVREAAIEREEPGEWIEIVGVVRDLTMGDPTRNDPVMYRAATPGAAHPVHVAVRVSGEPGALAPRLRAHAAAVDPALRLHDLQPMADVGGADRLAMRILVAVLAVVGSVALVLATAGVYSLMAFTVARRTREIGIRTALGADRRRIVTGIFSRAFAQVGLGILAGSVPGIALVAWGAPEIARGGGLAVGAAAFAGVALFVVVVALLACAVPATRALRVEPTEALRAQ